MSNPFHLFEMADWLGFWERIERERLQWEQLKQFVPVDCGDPDQEECPFCGLIGSCMCDELLQEQLDPEGLGLQEDYDY